MAVKVLDVIVGHADAIDGYVGLTNLLNGLVQRVFAEGIQAGGKQQDGFLSLDALQPVQRVQQSVKNVRLTKPGKVQVRDCVFDFFLVLGEIHFDAGLEIERHQRNPVFLVQVVDKIVRRVQRLTREIAVADLAEFHQDNHGDGRIRGSEIGDRLRHAVLENAEVFFFQAGDDVPVLRGGYNVHGDDGDFDGNRELSWLLFLLRLLLLRLLLLLLSGGLRRRRLRAEVVRGNQQRNQSGNQKEIAKSMLQHDGILSLRDAATKFSWTQSHRGRGRGRPWLPWLREGNGKRPLGTLPAHPHVSMKRFAVEKFPQTFWGVTFHESSQGAPGVRCPVLVCRDVGGWRAAPRAGAGRGATVAERTGESLR